MATHWQRKPGPWTVPLIVITALLALAAIVVHFMSLSNPALAGTGSLRNILWFATFLCAFITYFTARRPRR